VTDARGGPSTAGAVVIASDDSRAWSPVSRRVQVVRPDTEGAFEFRVPSGRYHVSHVAGLLPGQLWDPAFLKSMARGQPATAAEGQVTTVSVRVK
jgi:hypothetical protein